ncbi:MAG: hemolysin family protein [Acetobacterales bacterium]
MRALFGRTRPRQENQSQTLAELIDGGEAAMAALNPHERQLLSNILKQREMTVEDVMVPRADIVAVEETATLNEIVELMSRRAHSRLPVYRGTLDDVIGMIHIKDVLAAGGPERFRLRDILRKPLFVAPSMPILDLLLEMRMERMHMALVVDEHGGIDGLLTIEDVVEEIVGDIHDEHDTVEAPMLTRRADGNLDADARAPLEEVGEMIGPFLTEEDGEEDIDTLGGLVFRTAGRVPSRGECIAHPSGLEFEVVSADPRRIRRLLVRIPESMRRTPDSEAGENGARP